MSSQPRAVVGRERELDSLERFLDAVPEGAVGLRIEGDVGIGKTTLWKHAAAAARERSYRVLVSRPIESETQLAFAALGDLLEDVGAEPLAGLPEPQRRALEVALLRREAEGPAPHSRAVALGLLGVLRSLAQARARSWWPWTTSSGSIHPRRARSSSLPAGSGRSRSGCSWPSEGSLETPRRWTSNEPCRTTVSSGSPSAHSMSKRWIGCFAPASMPSSTVLRWCSCTPPRAAIPSSPSRSREACSSATYR